MKPLAPNERPPAPCNLDGGPQIDTVRWEPLHDEPTDQSEKPVWRVSSGKGGSGMQRMDQMGCKVT